MSLMDRKGQEDLSEALIAISSRAGEAGYQAIAWMVSRAAGFDQTSSTMNATDREVAAPTMNWGTRVGR